jgi:hypothetical protein
MRKKLLALLMCATMVLGTGVTAFAASPSATDYTNAKAIIDQYSAGKGYVEYEYDAAKSPVTFTTQYVSSNAANNVIYYYSFTGTNSSVKTDSTGKKAWTKTSGVTFDITAIDDIHGAISVTKTGATSDYINNSGSALNPSSTALSTASTKPGIGDLDKAVLKDKNGNLYYATVSTASAGTKLGVGQYRVYDYTTVTAGTTANNVAVALTADCAIVTIEGFTKAETGTVVTGDDAKKDTYGLDADNYIAREDSDASKTILQYTKAVSDGYWVNVTKAGSTAQTPIAAALADGTISKNAVAVQIDFYTTRYSSAVAKANDRATGTEYGFLTLDKVNAQLSDTEVTFKADWLSRSNAKNANTVYVLDNNVDTLINYFTKTGTIYKVSDFADGKFSTNYITSGVYLFDYVEDASQNDGVSDTDTTATTTAAAASTTAATSPKTGDVAPIAALAVVMMGACGAMVVASKKRA